MISRKKGEKLLLSLRRIVGASEVSWDESNPIAPFIVFPKTTQHVSKIMRLAYAEKITVTIQPGKTKETYAHKSGEIILMLSQMTTILQVYPEDLQVRVQAGISGDRLQAELRRYGFFSPVALSSPNDIPIGGIIASNHKGMHGVKYGHVRDWVLSLEIVLADGRVIRTGSRSFLPVAGYDLTALFLGSAGTLGIITEATLRLSSLPQAKTALLVAFSSVTTLLHMVHALVTMTNTPEAIEFLDASYMVLINEANNISLPEKPTLIIELSGDKKQVFETTNLVKVLGKKHRAILVSEYKTAKQQAGLRMYRHSVRPKLTSLLPHTTILPFAVGVPLSEVAKFLQKTDDLSAKYGLQTILFGHIGDGDIQGWIIYERDDKKASQTAVRLQTALSKLAVSRGGAITNEYGIGKRQLLSSEEQSRLVLQRIIKKQLDPKGILPPIL